MSAIYLYADEQSWQVLVGCQQKIILIGGDFGYGNFGDVLQHLNAVRFIKAMGRHAVVSVMAANAIGDSEFPGWARGAYDADAVIYVSEYPLVFDEKSPKLKAVAEIRNLAAVYLYGGGFLNEMWGGYCLSVVELFLRLSSGIGYFVSGQQITDPYQHVLIEHLKNFSPKIFGVRDQLSFQWLREVGGEALFSFDDATEVLIELARCSGLKRGAGLLLHLNSSEYTANESTVGKLAGELSLLKATAAAGEGVTTFQAFRDARQDVNDSMETIKKLDMHFPFYDMRIVDLVGLIFGRGGSGEEISGEFGYSCSYHVALWLQLAGIPCWLRSGNAFYSQKSRALQVDQDLTSFLREPRLADHQSNLERRSVWRSLLQDEFLKLDDVDNVCQVPSVADGPAPWPFFFKGTPTLQKRLTDAMENAAWHRERADAAEKMLERIAADSPATSDSDVAEQDNLAARAEIADLAGRVDALTAQLTEVGNMVHQQRARADAANEAMSNPAHLRYQCQCENGVNDQAILETRAAVHRLEEQLAAVRRSRSWRMTRIPRGIARYIRSGHFDSRGDVGLFEAVRRASRYLPISQRLRTEIGAILQKFRRK